MFKIFLDFLITHNSQTKATKTCLALKYKLIAIYFKLPSVHESYIFHKTLMMTEIEYFLVMKKLSQNIKNYAHLLSFLSYSLYFLSV